MKSLRLDPQLESRLQRAAAIKGESLSEFIRRSAAERANATLVVNQATDFDDILGVVHGGGGQARRTGAAFSDIVAEGTSKQ